MSSLTESEVLEIEGLTGFYEFCPELVVGKGKHESLLVSRLQNDHDLLNPVAALPI